MKDKAVAITENRAVLQLPVSAVVVVRATKPLAVLKSRDVRINVPAEEASTEHLFKIRIRNNTYAAINYLFGS